MRNNNWLAGLVLAGVLVAPVVAQQTTTHDHDAAAPAQQSAPMTMMDKGHQTMTSNNHQMMSENHQRMMADMNAANERIEQLVTKMNAEKGEQKVGTMAELLTTLAADRANLQRHMMEMASCPMAQSSTK